MNMLHRFALLAAAAVMSGTISTAQQWQQTSGIPRGSGITALAIKQSNGQLYATTGSFNWPSGDTGGVHRSTDGGDTWTRVFPANIGRTIAVKSNGIIFAGVRPTTNEGLYYSTNDGQSWTLALDVGPNNNVFAIAFDTVSFLTPNVAYAGSRSGLGVHRNTGGGIAGSWTTSSQGLPLGAWILALAVAPLPPPAFYGMALAGVMNPFNPATSGVYYSTNQGQGWAFASGIQAGDTVTSLIVAPDSATSGNGRFVFAGSSSGRIYRAYVTSGSSVVFSVVYSFTSSRVNAFSVIDPSPVESSAMHRTQQGNIFVLYALAEGRFPFSNAAVDSGGAFESLDYGRTWRERSQGIPAPLRMSSAATLRRLNGSQTLFAGKFLNQNSGGPVFKRDFVTGVEPNASEIPNEWVLDQNYPNPFNPATTIRFQVGEVSRQRRASPEARGQKSEVSHVALKIYDLLGREVATLVNEEMQPGSYERVFNADGLPSGVYMYRLTASSFSQTRKLLLLR